MCGVDATSEQKLSKRTAAATSLALPSASPMATSTSCAPTSSSHRKRTSSPSPKHGFHSDTLSWKYFQNNSSFASWVTGSGRGRTGSSASRPNSEDAPLPAAAPRPRFPRFCARPLPLAVAEAGPTVFVRGRALAGAAYLLPSSMSSSSSTLSGLGALLLSPSGSGGGSVADILASSLRASGAGTAWTSSSLALSMRGFPTP